MATTGMLTGNASSVKRWQVNGLEDFIDQYKKSYFGRWYQTGTIYETDEVSGRKPGDQVTLSFVPILTGVGTGEGGILIGNEEALNIKTDAFVVNVFRHAVNSPAPDISIEQQRTAVDFEESARELLPQHLMSRMDQSGFVQLAGCTATSITVDGTLYSGSNLTFVTGLNTVTAPSSNRQVWAGGAANDQSLSSTNTMTLDLIDDALVLIQKTYPYMHPLDGDGFDLYVSPGQYRDLKRDTTGKIQWYENQLARVKGGELSDSMLFDQNGLMTRPVGHYANVDIYVSTRVAVGVNSSTSAPISTVFRAVMVGKRALVWGSPFGRVKGFGDSKKVTPPFKYVDQLSDYGYYKGIGYVSIYGCKKIIYNGQDYGVCVLSTYAA